MIKMHTFSVEVEREGKPTLGVGYEQREGGGVLAIRGLTAEEAWDLLEAFEGKPNKAHKPKVEEAKLQTTKSVEVPKQTAAPIPELKPQNGALVVHTGEALQKAVEQPKEKKIVVSVVEADGSKRPVEAKPQEAPTATGDVPIELTGAGVKFKDVLVYLEKRGITDHDKLVEECQRLKPHVAVLSRIENLETRVRSAAETLGIGAGNGAA